MKRRYMTYIDVGIPVDAESEEGAKKLAIPLYIQWLQSTEADVVIDEIWDIPEKPPEEG